MSNSEVFDEFIKIAMEKGLVSEGEAEHTEQNTKSPRWDSLDLSAIEALYGVKPEQSKDMDYERNIMEVAHPNSMVIAPAYDKLNGLVENEMERQNIALHIVYKEPENGSPNQFRYPVRPTLLYPTPKYAQKDLLMSLVRVANDMDNKDKDELRVLADTCLAQMHAGFRKQAIIPIIVGIVAALGAVYLWQHLDDSDQGLKENYHDLQQKLQDFQTADITLGVGEKFDDTLKRDIMSLQSRLNEFYTAYSQAVPVIQAMEKPRDAEEVKQIAQSPELPNIQKAYATIKNEVVNLYPYLDKIESNFKNPDYKAEHTAEKGALTSLMDRIPGLHGGTYSLFTDKFDAAVNAIGPFKASIKRLLQTLSGAEDFKAKVQNDLAASEAKIETETAAPPAETAPTGAKSMEDLDKETAGLGEQLEGLKSFLPGL